MVFAFLVNEQNDFLEYPDAIYSSKTLHGYSVSPGEVLSVQPVFNQSTSLEVRTSSNSTGWVYYRYEDRQGVLHDVAPMGECCKASRRQNHKDTSRKLMDNQRAARFKEGYRNCKAIVPACCGDAEDELVFVAFLCTTDCPIAEIPFKKPVIESSPIAIATTIATPIGSIMAMSVATAAMILPTTTSKATATPMQVPAEEQHINIIAIVSSVAVVGCLIIIAVLVNTTPI